MELAAEHPQERRGTPRVDLEVQVLINPSGGTAEIVGWIQDVSHGGFRVKADIPSISQIIFNEGEEISFETFGYFPQFKGRGKVIWTSSDGQVAGVKFGELGEKSKTSLEEFLGIFNQLSTFPDFPAIEGNSDG